MSLWFENKDGGGYELRATHEDSERLRRFVADLSMPREDRLERIVRALIQCVEFRADTDLDERATRLVRFAKQIVAEMDAPS